MIVNVVRAATVAPEIDKCWLQSWREASRIKRAEVR